MNSLSIIDMPDLCYYSPLTEGHQSYSPPLKMPIFNTAVVASPNCTISCPLSTSSNLTIPSVPGLTTLSPSESRPTQADRCVLSR